MHSDQPHDVDQLERRPFAQKIAHIIASQSNADPLVISINGPWGDGKSTVFRFLKEELKKNDVPTLIFNPWRYPHEDDLLRAFFVQLAEKLDDPLFGKTERIGAFAKKHLKWGKSAIVEVSKKAPLPAADKMAGALLDQMETWLTPTLDELNERMRKKLYKRKKRIAILLDDPDRLEEEELFALFRLIKLTADFPYTTFVLAMDYDAVAKTIGRRFNSTEEGRKFLEKIIQVPLRLPAVPRLQLSDFALELIRDALANLKIELSKEEWKRFEAKFGAFVLPRIVTPRLAKRYANALTFTLGLLAGEVNEVDVMLLEAVRLFEIDAFDRLMRYLMRIDEPYWVKTIDSDAKKRIDAALTWILPNKSEESDYADLRGLLISLFPLRLSAGNHTEKDEIRERQYRRVACDDCFVRYAACVVPDNDIPDSDTEGLLEMAASGDSGILSGMLEALYNEKRAHTLMHRLFGCLGRMSDVQKRCLAEAVTSISRHFSSTSNTADKNAIFESAVRFVGYCIAELQPSSARETLIQHAIDHGGTWFWGAMVFHRLPVYSEAVMAPSASRQPDSPLEAIQMERLGERLASRIMDEIPFMTSLPHTDVLRFGLQFWEKFGDTTRLRTWTKRQLSTDPDYLRTLVSMQLIGSHSDGERTYEWPGDERMIDGLRKQIDLVWLIQSNLPLPPVAERTHPPFISVEEAVERLFDLLKNWLPPAEDPESPPAQAPDEKK